MINTKHQQDQQALAESGKISKLSDHHKPKHQTCPRCESDETKFCYYNNYNISQPRYYCKTCRRHWTHGGNLRDVPVGGSCRKRAKLSLASSSSGNDYFITQLPPPQLLQPPKKVDVTHRNYANLGMMDLGHAGVGGGYLSLLAAMWGYPIVNGNLVAVGNSSYRTLQETINVSNFGSQEQMLKEQPSEEFIKMGNEVSGPCWNPNLELGNWPDNFINSNADVLRDFSPFGPVFGLK